jgi:hypothetical protein
MSEVLGLAVKYESREAVGFQIGSEVTSKSTAIGRRQSFVNTLGVGGDGVESRLVLHPVLHHHGNRCRATAGANLADERHVDPGKVGGHRQARDHCHGREDRPKDSDTRRPRSASVSSGCSQSVSREQ